MKRILLGLAMLGFVMAGNAFGADCVDYGAYRECTSTIQQVSPQGGHVYLVLDEITEEQSGCDSKWFYIDANDSNKKEAMAILLTYKIAGKAVVVNFWESNTDCKIRFVRAK